MWIHRQSQSMQKQNNKKKKKSQLRLLVPAGNINTLKVWTFSLQSPSFIEATICQFIQIIEHQFKFMVRRKNN